MATATILAKLTVVSISLGMTGKTIREGVFEEVVRMTIIAGNLGVFAHQRKSRFGVVEGNQLPIYWGMTVFTLSTKLTVMDIVFSVAGVAVLGSALENVIDMTTFAVNLGVFAHQRKASFGVVKGSLLPIHRSMATATILSKLTVVSIVLCVTRIACLRGD
jgi:hypothetical protein